MAKINYITVDATYEVDWICNNGGVYFGTFKTRNEAIECAKATRARYPKEGRIVVSRCLYKMREDGHGPVNEIRRTSAEY
jgi:hypothetical protein